MVYAIQRKCEHDGDVPWSETAVARNGHGEGTEHENHQSGNETECRTGLRDKFACERKGIEHHVGLHEIAGPDAECPDHIHAAAFHGEEHLETVPDVFDAGIHAAYPFVASEEVANGPESKDCQRD